MVGVFEGEMKRELNLDVPISTCNGGVCAWCFQVPGFYLEYVGGVEGVWNQHLHSLLQAF